MPAGASLERFSEKYIPYFHKLKIVQTLNDKNIFDNSY